MVCECAQNWRLELVNLGNGETLSAIVPEAFEFSTDFLGIGRGSVRFNMRGTTPPVAQLIEDALRMNRAELYEMYPGDTGVVMQRVQGGDASWSDPDVPFVGIVETLEGSPDGEVSLGLVEISDYPNHRVLRNDLVFSSFDQTGIAAGLIFYIEYGTASEGAPAIDTIWNSGENASVTASEQGTPSVTRDRTYVSKDRPIIGELVKQLTQVENGPVYVLRHFRDAMTGDWRFSFDFYDPDDFDAAFPPAVITFSDVDDFRLRLERRDRANNVEVFSQDSSGAVVREIADADADLAFAASAGPLGQAQRYDVALTYDSDTSGVLTEYADGVLLDRFDAAGLVTLHFSGVEYSETLDLGQLRPGMLVNAVLVDERLAFSFVAGPDIDVPIGGGTTLQVDDLRIGRLSVSVQPEGPEKVTATLATSKPLLPIKFGG